MRFERTEPFKADYRRLTDAERQLFREAVRAFNLGADRFATTQQSDSWPAKLRVKPVANAPGIFEMTWSFAGPDGRATWQWNTGTDAGGHIHPAVLWRRLGGHGIFRAP